jgi:hypothetical protein
MKSIYRLIKNTSLKAYSLILLAFVCSILGLSGCLQGFTMSTSQVDEYYAALPPKPDFSYAEYEHKNIFCSINQHQSQTAISYTWSSWCMVWVQRLFERLVAIEGI